jgi:hypothetical protein
VQYRGMAAQHKDWTREEHNAQGIGTTFGQHRTSNVRTSWCGGLKNTWSNRKELKEHREKEEQQKQTKLTKTA